MILQFLYAFLAALFYAINIPCSKLLLTKIPAACMAGFLYLGAGLGIGIVYLFHLKNQNKTKNLSKADLPYTLAMILLDIAAPILLMQGIKTGSSSSASLLGNFEIVATTIIAMAVFKEKVSGRLWISIILITLASMILSFESLASLKNGILEFSTGSLFVLGATLCWGIENNCTRRLSEKNTYQIVTVKGLASGTGSLIVAALLGDFNFTNTDRVFDVRFIPLVLLLGFIAYGLSIFTYIRAQKYLGAAKTSAFYAVNPFVGALLSFLLLGEKLTAQYFTALIIMIIGIVFLIIDTLSLEKDMTND
jgi:drug/metabolite transporter (DMT)-like permease